MQESFIYSLCVCLYVYGRVRVRVRVCVYVRAIMFTYLYVWFHRTEAIYSVESLMNQSCILLIRKQSLHSEYHELQELYLAYRSILVIIYHNN